MVSTVGDWEKVKIVCATTAGGGEETVDDVSCQDSNFFFFFFGNKLNTNYDTKLIYKYTHMHTPSDGIQTTHIRAVFNTVMFVKIKLEYPFHINLNFARVRWMVVVLCHGFLLVSVFHYKCVCVGFLLWHVYVCICLLP